MNTYFYWLILIQALVIIIRFNLTTLENFNQTIKNDENNQNVSINIISEIYTTIFQGQNYCYIFIYPLILMLKQLNKEQNFLRKIAFLFYWIQYPFLEVFIHQVSLIIKQYYPELIMSINICFALFILNLTFVIINQQFLRIKIQNKRKTLYILFLLLVINLLYNIITVNNHNWIPYLIINAYIQMYLIHIDSNLFQNNKYNQQQKPLIKILFERIPFFNREEQINQFFVIKKDKALLIFIILPFIIYFTKTLPSINVLIILIAIIIQFILFIQLDTSLVSTSSKFELKDQWLAADLFILDLLLPFRNIVMFLLLD
ncbi:unnamed protein product [Paramecium pentaurelia]|uniref:Uncharacterized protein n=1 Tax=Paramecium pentaurelia TaxID=43138 RepID=A0A8S1VUA3_9CILI|nr:unnamed protein product [Paramecium pentaurelia]